MIYSYVWFSFSLNTIFSPSAIFICVCLFWMHVCLCTTFVHCPRRPGEGVGSPETGVPGGCEPPCGYWKSSQGLLEEEPGFLHFYSPLNTIFEMSPFDACVCVLYCIEMLKVLHVVNKPQFTSSCFS